MPKVSCLVLLFVLVGCSAASVQASNNGCPRALAMEALDVAGGTIPDWRAMHQAFIKYRKCDDGAIGQGFSDAIVKLLANRWEDLGDLQSILDFDSDFEEFVIRHIDATVDEGDLRSVAANSEFCREQHTALCHKIHTRANEALASL